MKRRILNFLICLDQLVFSVLTLGHASPDETISAGLYRMESQNKRAGRWFRPVVDWLFLPFEKDHCRESYLAEYRKLQLPGSYRV